MRISKFIGFLGVVCIIVGIFAPFFVVSLFGFNIESSLFKFWEGKVSLGLVAILTLYIFIDIIPSIRKSKIGELNPKISLIFTLAIAGLVAYLFIAKWDAIRYLSFGWGFYVFLVGIGFTIIYGLTGGNSYYYEEVSSQINAGHIQTDTINQVPGFNVSQNTYVQPEVETQNIETKLCPKCGTKNEMTASNCSRCAYSLINDDTKQNN